MGSQSDLDQGGTTRFLQRQYLGPSLGWIDAVDAILRINNAGTTLVQLGSSVITVNTGGLVTIQLPAFKNTNPALRGQIRDIPLVIVDIGGFASGANPITILAASGETISGLTQVQITSAYGAVILQPDPVNGGCSVASGTSIAGAPLNSPAFTGVPTAPTAALGTNTTQIATTAFVTTAIGPLGVIPENSKSANYTTVLGDAGQFIYHPASDANARTFTIDSNANVAYVLGTVISFVNLSVNVLTIGITADTMYLAGPGTTGSRTLAQYGCCTALKTDATTWIISGTGLT